MRNGTRLAALDLGSNSFRLEIGKYDRGQIHRVEYLKEAVRQGAGLDENNNLSLEAMQRGWDCLARFSERLAGIRTSQIRAVATQTLREAANRDVFLSKAHQILGFPIDVVSGREEARLIYQGVSNLLPRSTDRRLVVDIGGRSTEMILGRNLEAQQLESFQVGSVTWSIRYFPDGKYTEGAFRKAVIAARAMLDEAAMTFRAGKWDVAYGSSGTIGAVTDILAAGGFPPGMVTMEGLLWLRQRLIKARDLTSFTIAGLKDERKPVLAGGLCVLMGVFEVLQIREMAAAQGALRQGVLYDLIDREQSTTDLRAESVALLMEKFCVDHKQATRVERTAMSLYRQMPHLDDSVLAERRERKLRWAARLHEIGAHISHSNYHRHGAYILDHAEAPGFALPELHYLSLLVLGHRGKLHKLDTDFSDAVFVSLLLSLRLAVIFCHARRTPVLDDMRLARRVAPSLGFTLSVSRDWAASYPQSMYLLRQETEAWDRIGLSFKVVVK